MREKLRTAALILSISCASMIGMIDLTPVEAEIKTIEADGMYIMGDGTKENPAVAKERAREDAKRAASEKASVYVESLSEMNENEITKDVVRTVSSSVLQVTSSDVTAEVAADNALIFRCHIVALVDSDKVLGQLKKDGAELAEAARRNKELEEQISKVNAELATLKDRYAAAQDEAERNKIREQVRLNEQKFETNQLIEQGNNRLMNRDFYAAIQSYREALIGDPGNSVVYNNLGFTCEQTHDYDAAILHYQKAIECDARYVGAHYNLGNVYYRRQEYRQAIENYLRTIELDDQFIAAYNNLGLAYENLGEYDKAIDSFTRAIEKAPDKSGRSFAGLYNNRGTCYQRMERFDAALSDYDKALEIDPAYSEPKLNAERLRAWLNG